VFLVLISILNLKLYIHWVPVGWNLGAGRLDVRSNTHQNMIKLYLSSILQHINVTVCVQGWGLIKISLPEFTEE